jgi:PAS domain S-box-containing protein
LGEWLNYTRTFPRQRKPRPAIFGLRFFYLLFITSLFIFPAISQVYALEPANPAKSVTFASEITLKTIIIDNYAPYTFVNKEGKPDGFSVDLIRAMAQVMGINLEIKGETFLGFVSGIILTFLLIGVVLLIWSVSLKKQVAGHTKSLELEGLNRKQAQVSLQESEASFRSIFEKSATGYVLTAPDGRLLKINAALAEMLGYSIDELQLINFREITHPNDIAISTQSLRALLAGERESFQFEKRYLHRNGATIWTFVNTSLVCDAQNSPQYFITSITDISERKKIEHALRESEYFFKESQRLALIGSYKTDFKAGLWESSEALDQVFGIDQNYSRSIQGWLAIVHPQDLEMMERYLREDVLTEHKQFNKDYRIIRKSDGESRWVHGTGEVGFDTDGNVISLLGTIQDITERKLAEEGIKEKADVLEHFNKLMVDRELRMIELKQEINALCVKSGQPPRYLLDFAFSETADGSAIQSQEITSTNQDRAGDCQPDQYPNQDA